MQRNDMIDDVMRLLVGEEGPAFVSDVLGHFGKVPRDSVDAGHQSPWDGILKAALDGVLDGAREEMGVKKEKDRGKVEALNKLRSMVSGTKQPPAPSDTHTHGFGATDVREMETFYAIIMDLPGISKAAINITVKDGNIIVSAQRFYPSSSDNFQMRERFTGSMVKTVPIPSGAVVSSIRAASFVDGVLTITIFKPRPPEIPEEFKVNIDHL